VSDTLKTVAHFSLRYNRNFLQYIHSGPVESIWTQLVAVDLLTNFITKLK